MKSSRIVIKILAVLQIIFFLEEFFRGFPLTSFFFFFFLLNTEFIFFSLFSIFGFIIALLGLIAIIGILYYENWARQLMIFTAIGALIAIFTAIFIVLSWEPFYPGFYLVVPLGGSFRLFIQQVIIKSIYYGFVIWYFIKAKREFKGVKV